MAWLFILLMVSFAEMLILMKTNLSTFSYKGYDFGVVSKGHHGPKVT